MNKYTGLSDFEINKKVAINVGGLALSLMAFDDQNGIVKKNIPNIGLRVFTEFNPCNNPSDAMQIIIENDIDLLNGENMMPELFGHHSAYTLHNFNTPVAADSLKEDKTIYRLGMEVFLMKKDAESNQ